METSNVIRRLEGDRAIAPTSALYSSD
ncbi:hypothetical protein RAZWK3B_01290 [Roseobacter sp. AzwK-3b]|nr:hypothetical protein RAZWK3B_01290 [Roseobacter sp. AzwK-3b]